MNPHQSAEQQQKQVQDMQMQQRQRMEEEAKRQAPQISTAQQSMQATGYNSVGQSPMSTETKKKEKGGFWSKMFSKDKEKEKEKEKILKEQIRR